MVNNALANSRALNRSAITLRLWSTKSIECSHCLVFRSELNLVKSISFIMANVKT